ncbi:MAG: sulfotransferase domain-containing protein [Pseudomonadota bacterium]
MTLPNFIIAGAPKSGSSSLWNYMRQHPDVYFPENKELFFFDFNFDKGLSWYENWFADHQSQKAVGEATVWYMRWDEVPERMAQTLPDVKLIFLLRNPVDRAYSNWCHDMRDGRYPFDQSFEAFLETSTRDDRKILSSGYYDEHIERFLRYYSLNQMFICTTRELRTDASSVCRNLFAFLEIDPEQAVTSLEQDNVSWWFHRGALLRAANTFTAPVKYLGLKPPVRTLWSSSRHFRQLFWNKTKRPPKISSKARDYLADHYAPHVTRLEALSKRSFPEWK